MRAALLLLSTFCTIGVCCRNSNSELQENLANASRDTMEIDIPRYADGSESNIYKYVRQMTEKLHIERIDSGYIPFQIRIWYYYGLVDTNQLLIVKREKDKWISQWYTISFNSGPSKSDTAVTIIKDENPKHGWIPFINSLFELKMGELPNMDKLPGIANYSFTEPSGVNVEFAAINRYRLYSYYALNSFKNKWWQVKNMSDILRLVEKEFGFKRLKE